MTGKKEPRYAAGQELTLHPGDPVRGAELLRDQPEAAGETPARAPRPKQKEEILPRYL